jgi:hypothetical protein
MTKSKNSSFVVQRIKNMYKIKIALARKITHKQKGGQHTITTTLHNNAQIGQQILLSKWGSINQQYLDLV